MNVARASGRKDDTGKRELDLLPFGALEQVGDVLTFGAHKYAPDNWKRVKNWRRRYLSAALRHLFTWARGEKNDPETGCSHLAHAVCCLLFIMELETIGRR